MIRIRRWRTFLWQIKRADDGHSSPPSLRSSCKKHSFDFGLRSVQRHCRIDLLSAVLNLVAKESFIFCPPSVAAAHTFSPSSLDGFDMAHILEKSRGSSKSPVPPPLKPFFNALLPPEIPLRSGQTDATELLIAEKCEEKIRTETERVHILTLKSDKGRAAQRKGLSSLHLNHRLSRTNSPTRLGSAFVRSVMRHF